MVIRVRRGNCLRKSPLFPRPARPPFHPLCCVTVAIRRPRAGPHLRPSAEHNFVCVSGAAERNQRMPQQPELTSHPLPASPAQQPGPSLAPPASAAALDAAKALSAQDHEHIPQRIPRWLERAELFLRVLLRMYIGLAVCYAPWSHLFWDQNPIFLQFPTLSIYAANGAVRGIVSGLGLLNLWIAFHDAIRHGTEKD